MPLHKPNNLKTFLGKITRNLSAVKTGMTPNAVSHRIRRVREDFRAYLEERGYTV